FRTRPGGGPAPAASPAYGCRRPPAAPRRWPAPAGGPPSRLALRPPTPLAQRSRRPPTLRPPTLRPPTRLVLRPPTCQALRLPMLVALRPPARPPAATAPAPGRCRPPKAPWYLPWRPRLPRAPRSAAGPARF